MKNTESDFESSLDRLEVCTMKKYLNWRSAADKAGVENTVLVINNFF